MEVALSLTIMPAQPAWLHRVDDICRELDSLPRPWLERADIEALLRVRRRRAQQILEACSTAQVGSSSVTTPEALAAHLRRMASGTDAEYELRRREKVGQALSDLRRTWTSQPRVVVEAPVQVASQKLRDLPEGVELSPGCITVRFSSPQEALERLLALAMAIGNDLQEFQETIGPGSGD